MLKRVLTFLLFSFTVFAVSCSGTDSRIVDKPFEELAWIERTRSPVALAMAERHYRYTASIRYAYKHAQSTYQAASTIDAKTTQVELNQLFEFKKLYQDYQADLISNLWKVLFLKPDHRTAIYELISLLEEKWYLDADNLRGTGVEYEVEMQNLAQLEKALRLGSDFYGRDYDVNYKLGAILYRQAHIMERFPELAATINPEKPPTVNERLIDARLFLRKCVAVRSMHAEAYRLLALIHEKLGKEEDAYKYWKLITVVEQAELRSGMKTDDPDRASIYEVARAKVEEYESKTGIV